MVIRPALPPPCAESATIRVWGSEQPAVQQRPVFPHMHRSASEGPRPVRYGRVVMKRRETERPILFEEEKADVDSVAVEKPADNAATVAIERVTLARAPAIRRAGRKNKENIYSRVRRSLQM